MRLFSMCRSFIFVLRSVYTSTFQWLRPCCSVLLSALRVITSAHLSSLTGKSALSELTVIKSRIESVLRHQLVVISLLDNIPVFHYQNNIRILDR